MVTPYPLNVQNAGIKQRGLQIPSAWHMHKQALQFMVVFSQTEQRLHPLQAETGAHQVC